MKIHSGHAFDPSLSAFAPREGFAGTRVLVIGDLMLDRYVFGEVTRISPEAPVPVLNVKGQRSLAGGAANVALNVAGLKAQALLAGVVGDDLAGRSLKEMLVTSDINVCAVVTDSARPTTCKTRVMSDNHQIVRMDEETCAPLSVPVSTQIFEKLLPLLDGGVDAAVISDYAKGVMGISFTKSVIAECRLRRIPVLVDPKRADYSPYSGATCVTPNLKEFKMALEEMSLGDEDIALSGAALRSRLGSEALLITQGPDGMTLVTAEHSHHLHALAEDVFDVSGAGDTVIATVATAIASGLDLLTAAKLSNAAASIVVRRAGTTPISWADLASLIFRETGDREHQKSEITRDGSVRSLAVHQIEAQLA